MKKRSGILTKVATSLLLVVCMLASLMMTAFAVEGTANEEQIEDAGGVKTAPHVSVSKTIEPTDIENVFDITLKVQTDTYVEKVVKEPDMAIVIVMDISNTMNEKFGDTTRYQAAMDAASQLIDKFAAKSKDVSVARDIGFVAFNTDAKVILNMSACKTTAQATNLKKTMKSGTSAIINADGYAYSHSRFTNIEAGLKCGYDLINKSKAENKYIVFLSDGFPTTYIQKNYKGYDPYMSSGVAKNNIGKDGYFYDEVFNTPCTYGTSYSDKGALKAQNMADSIKKAGVGIFSIGVDVGGQTIQQYIDKSKGQSYSIVDRSGKTYVIGDATKTTSYANWLKTKIGSNWYQNTENASALTKALNDALTDATNQTIEKSLDVWKTKDPIPAGIEFLDFYNKSGALKDSLTGSNVKNGENTASIDNKDITWDMKESGYKTASVNGTTQYTYELKYRVRLENEVAAFNPDAEYKTNGTTTLTYRYEENEKHLDSTVDYKIPEVKGYWGEFTLQKADKQTKEALAGAEFTLKHDPKCTVCNEVGHLVSIKDQVKVSDSKGSVKFDKIPSGHEYICTETKMPYGYIADNGSNFTVEVKYGKTNLSIGNNVAVTNVKDDTTSMEIVAEKVVTGNKTTSNLKFNLELSPVSYTKPTDRAGLASINPPMPADAENGKKVISIEAGAQKSFGTITYTQPGTYVYSVKELAGAIKGWTYDSTVYTITDVVTDNGNGAQLKIARTISSGAASTAQSIKFVNNYSVTPVETSISAQKEVKGDYTAIPETFQFNLTAVSYTAPRGVDVTMTVAEMPLPAGAANGVATGSVSGAGTVNFGSWSYDTIGTYVYTVKEVAGNNNAWTYDSTMYTITDTVTDDGQGNLTLKRAITKGEQAVDELVFTNEYTVMPVTGSVQITKEITGDTSREPTDFQFELAAMSYAAPQGLNVSMTADEMPMPDAASVSITNAGEATFENITFVVPGTYTYTVSEVAGDNYHWTYDDNVYQVIFNVTEDGKGKLDVEPTIVNGENQTSDSISFVNVYSVTPLKVDISAVKTIAGDYTAFDETFNFEMSAVSYTAPQGVNVTMAANEMPMPINAENGVATSYVIGAGTADFGDWSYDTVGTYVYTIKETAGRNNAWTYDGTVYTVTDTVTDDGEGSFILNREISAGGEATREVVFANKYTVIPAVCSINVTKEITGETPREIADFEFVLEPVSYTASRGSSYVMTADEMPMPGASSVFITGAGEAIFDNITFTVAGTYEYSVSEVAGDDYHWTYDDGIYTVIFEVTEDGQGNLTVTPSVIKANGEEEAESDSVVFVNVYTIGRGGVMVTKTVEYADMDSKNQDKKFDFTISLLDENGQVASGDLTCVFTDTSGNITESTITLNDKGEYSFQLGDGESMLFNNVPEDWSYVVKEATNKHFRTEVNGESKNSAEGTVVYNQISMVNVKNVEIPKVNPFTPATGDAGIMLWLVMGLLSAAGVTLVMFYRRRNAK